MNRFLNWYVYKSPWGRLITFLAGHLTQWVTNWAADQDRVLAAQLDDAGYPDLAAQLRST